MNYQVPKMSEGEEYILEYFKDERIRFEKEVKIDGLKDDGPAYRVADFYLPDYGIYLEFFGQWHHSEENRNRYNQKKNSYFHNGIPCIYIYPDNLGILEFIFPKRLEKTLKIHNLNKQLFRWRLIKSLKENTGNFLAFALSLALLVYTIIPPVNADHILIFLSIALFPLVRILYKSFKIFNT
jgi:hypothetical protein